MNQPEQRIRIVTWSWIDGYGKPITEKRVSHIQDLTPGYTSAGKFNAETQTAMERLIRVSLSPDHSVSVQGVTE